MMVEHQQPAVDDLIQALGDSIFAPETLQQVRDRIARIDSTACMCGDTPHENALHDLAHDDVPVLLRAIERLAPQRITTVEQLDALPIGAVVRTDEGRVAVKTGEHWGNQSGYGSWWDEAGEEVSCGSDELDDLPAIALWLPEWGNA